MKIQLIAQFTIIPDKAKVIFFYKLHFFVVMCVFSITNIGIAQDLTNLLNMQEVRNLRDSGSINVHNNDNRIFISRKIFTYKPTFSDSTGNKYCRVFFNKQCTVDKQVPCIDWKYSTTMEPDSQSYPITSIRLYIYERKLSNSLSEKQTLIKYDYYYGSDRIFMGEQTGIVEDSLRLFIHPPRSYAFALTEFNPFVDLRLPLHPGKKWKSFIGFPITYTQKAKIIDIAGTDPIHFDFAYQVTDQVQIDTRLGVLPCIVIHAIGTSTLGNTASTFYFNEQYGVVDVLYQNIDKSTLRLELLAVSDNN